MKCPNCSFLNEDSHHFCSECGTSLISDSEDPVIPTETVKLPLDIMVPGTVFAKRYRIISELGRGGMGRVFRVADTKVGEEIALKLIRADASTDPTSVERFKNELKSARKIVHKNVARVFDLNEEDGVPYITMEFVKGENLKLLIDREKGLSPGQAVPIARQICEGLAEAHRQGVIHRDLKPQNVIIDESGEAKILDFGLARLQKAEGMTETGEVIATPAYIAPERVEGLPAEGRVDLYSLGIVL